MDTTDFRTQMNADDTKEGKHFMGKRLLVIISYWLGNTKTKTIGMGNSVSHRGSISVRVCVGHHNTGPHFINMLLLMYCPWNKWCPRYWTLT